MPRLADELVDSRGYMRMVLTRPEACAHADHEYRYHDEISY